MKKDSEPRHSRIAKFGVIGFYVLTGILILAIYWNVWAFDGPAIAETRTKYDLCWPDPRKDCTESFLSSPSRFLYVPLTVRFNGSEPVQNQPVIIHSEAGTATGSLAQNLTSVRVSFSGSTPYMGEREVDLVAGAGLRLDATYGEVSKVFDFEDSVGLVGRPATVMWQSERDDFPTVTLVYSDGSVNDYPFEEASFHIRSSEAHESAINDYIQSRKEETYGILTGVGVVVGVVYALAFKKELV